jgi:hypothetical protein
MMCESDLAMFHSSPVSIVVRTPAKGGKKRTDGGAGLAGDSRMHLVQLLLPVVRRTDPGTASADVYRALRAELVARFGGVTAYTRSPARGAWLPEGDEDPDDAVQDDVVMLEVVTPALDHSWWIALRSRLERELEQESIHLRAIAIELL